MELYNLSNIVYCLRENIRNFQTNTEFINNILNLNKFILVFQQFASFSLETQLNRDPVLKRSN